MCKPQLLKSHQVLKSRLEMETLFFREEDIATGNREIDSNLDSVHT